MPYDTFFKSRGFLQRLYHIYKKLSLVNHSPSSLYGQGQPPEQKKFQIEKYESGLPWFENSLLDDAF